MSSLASPFTSDVLAALESQDVKAFETVLAVAEGRKKGTLNLSPALRALGMFGVERACNFHSALDPELHPELKTVDLAPCIAAMVQKATDLGMIEDEIFEPIRSEGCAARCLPAVCPHASCGGGNWLYCGPAAEGGCQGFSCDNCGAPRPLPWKGCYRYSRCRDFYIEPELTQVCIRCSPPFVSVACATCRSAALRFKPLADACRAVCVTHRARQMDAGFSMMHTPVPNKPVSALPTPGAPAKEVSSFNACFEAFKLQNNNNPMPTEMRPPIDLVKLCCEALSMDPPTIPRLAKLKNSFVEDPPAPRYRLIREFIEAGMALALAMAAEMGVGHLEHLVNSVPGDEINAKVAGSTTFVRVAAKILQVNAFFTAAGAHTEDLQADPKQSQEFFVKLWDISIRKLIENKRCSLTQVTEEIGSRGFDDLPAKRAAKGGGRGGGGGAGGGSTSRGKGALFTKKSRNDSDSDDDSDDDKKKKKSKKGRSDRDKSKPKDKKGSKKGKSKAKESSDDSDSSGDDSDDSARGGSANSILPCYPFMFDKKGCRSKDCEYSHRASVIKKYKEEKKKKKAKADDDE
jgi:hypothetical protein